MYTQDVSTMFFVVVVVVVFLMKYAVIHNYEFPPQNIRWENNPYYKNNATQILQNVTLKTL